MIQLSRMIDRYCVVTTEHRAVVGGFLVDYDPDRRVATLTEARVCVHWSADVRGFVGLAAGGPDSKSRVSPACPRLALCGVTSILLATDAAAEAWRSGPWA